MAENQPLSARRSGSVLPFEDLGISAADPDCDGLNKKATLAGRRLRYIGEGAGVGFAGNDSQRSHTFLERKGLVIVIGGVAGSGKTTVGRALAARLQWRFQDADELHDPANVERMRHGIPLDDDQRQPWLLRVRRVIEYSIAAREDAVIACSALKAQYRRVLSDGLEGVEFVFLQGDREVLRARLEQRPGHFAGAALLGSQLQTLELPPDGLIVDARLEVDHLVDLIVATWSLRP